MANKTMHHVVIGDDTFELIDEAGREETTALKEDLTQYVVSEASTITVMPSSTTVNGVTYVRDGNSIVANGTATANSKVFLSPSSYLLPSELGIDTSIPYVLTGCPDGGASDKYKLCLDATRGATYNDFGSGVEISLDGRPSDIKYAFAIVVYSGTTVENLRFTPKCVSTYRLDNRIATISANEQETIKSFINNSGNEYSALLQSHFLMPDGTVSSVTSGGWDLYAFNVLSGYDYIIDTYVNGIGVNDIAKTWYAVISKGITNSISYNSSDVLEISEVLGGGKSYAERPMQRRVTIKSQNAKTLIVAYGRNGISRYPLKVFPTVADKEIKYNIGIDDIAAFGTKSDDVYQFTESFTITVPNSTKSLPKIITTFAKYSGSEAPTIQFRQGSIYLSNVFDIGNDIEYSVNSWRIPSPVEANSVATLIFAIPDGTTLYMKAFDACENDKTSNYQHGIRLNAHLGLLGMCPENTMFSFYMAYKNGYPACITVPKVTADGKLVCFHDDDTITRLLRNADGTTIEGTYKISDLTYDEILQYDAGIYLNNVYAGEKVPLLEDFFTFCAQTGMMPILSTHPALTTSEWEEVKRLAQSVGILNKLRIKSFDLAILATAHSVFGNSVDGYTYDVNTFTDPSVKVAEYSALNLNAKCLAIEWDSTYVTQEAINETISGGFIPSVWNVARMTGARYKQLIKMGISEFVDDYNCCFGLPW